MLVIRREQLQEFIARDEGEVVDVVRRAIRVANGARVDAYPDAELDKMIAIGIERARSHGFKFAEDIAAFVAIMFEVAPRFDEHPEIKAILSDENIPTDLRFDHLFGRITDDVWLEAQKRYEDSFWFPDEK